MNRIEINELRQNRAAIFNQATSILDAAGNNPLNAEQREKWEKHMADIDAMGERVKAEERRLQLEAELTDTVREPQRPEVRTEAKPAYETRAARMAAPEYREAFNAWLRSPEGVAGISPEHRSMLNEYRAQSIATNSAGGFLVPTGFRANLVEALKAFGGVRGESGATVLTTDSGNALPIPTANDTTQTGELVAENTAVTPQDIAFNNVTLNAYKYSSKSVLISFELLQDSAINLESYVNGALATRLARIHNTHFTTGTGSSQPQGVVTAASAGKTAASATAITYSEVLDLIHSVDRAHRKGGKFMFNDAVLKAIKQLADSQGRPLWMPSVREGDQDMFLGYPYVINQDMATIATGNKTMLFGDFQYYTIRDVMDVTLYRIVDKYIEQGSVGFLAYMRSDAKLVNPGSNPIKYLVQA
jgi:HK97 family phage major capsid protein